MESIKWDSILDKFFDENTMSVHFKENTHILRKKGHPGWWVSEKIKDNIPTKNFLTNLINTLFKEVENRKDAFLEIDKNFSKVLQIGPYRIVIVLPPLSDGVEITAVKPVKKLSLPDYNLDEKVIDLFQNKAQGILISWAPGEGKTTFAQALVEFYVEQNKIVKTIESPRDLLVPEEVTQYSFSYAPHNEIRDILLLSRPDFTVYDEVRNTEDFILFKDLRLTWIGLIGVIHATRPIDSIQRFLGTIEMGIIPQVVDTIIFIKGGKIAEIFQTKQVVKVPEGLQSDDLARPVIQVLDFFTQEVKYEIYSFGEEVVVIPLDQIEKKASQQQGVMKYAKDAIDQQLKLLINAPFITSIKWAHSLDLYVPNAYKWQIIGKWGANISQLENNLGISINVKPLEEIQTFVPKIEYQRQRKREIAIVHLPPELVGKTVYLIIGDSIMSSKVPSDGKLHLKGAQLIKKIKSQGIKVAIA